MATIGQPLPQPEEGWKRYDDTHPAIKYEGKWRTSSAGSDKYNDTFQYTEDINAKASFNFMGTSLRIVTFFERQGSSDILITIDGKEYHYSNQKENKTPVALSFELTDLENKIHTVKIRTNIDNQQLTIDAIDIDENGELLHPDEVTSPDELEIGKRIRCHYSATSNSVGVFSNLGKEVYVDGINDFIPPASSATPNGSFYFIMVGYEYDGRPKLIADRNIQHSISWDTINTQGMTTTGREIKLGEVVLNKEDSNGGTVDNTGLSYTSTTSSQGIRAIKGVTEGKWYWEIELTTSTTSMTYGISNKNYTYNSPIGNNDQRSLSGNGNKRPEDTSYAPSLSNGDIIGVALDLDIGTLEFFINGISYGISHDNIKDMGEVFPMVRSGTSVARSVNFNFGSKPFIYPIPEGFKPYNYDEVNENYIFTIRLLTGGINSTDKDNEWDEYIVSSDLNGTITAGDNNVWSWSGIFTKVSTTSAVHGSSAYKSVRGNNSAGHWAETGSTNGVFATHGFRPMLLIESLSQPPKLIIYGNNKYKFLNNSSIIDLPITNLTKEDFDKYGLEELTFHTKEFTEKKLLSESEDLTEGSLFTSDLDLNVYSFDGITYEEDNDLNGLVFKLESTNHTIKDDLGKNPKIIALK